VAGESPGRMDYGERTQYKHDPLNATTRTIDSRGSSTSLVYDPNESLTSETYERS